VKTLAASVVAIAVHHNHGCFLERRYEEHRRMRLVMADVDDRRQAASRKGALEPSLQPEIQESDAGVLHCVGPRMREAQGCRKAAKQDRGKRAPQPRDVPGRGDVIDLGKAATIVAEEDAERVTGEALRMLLAEMALFLQNAEDVAILD
jgi:hypothetical protein